MKVNKYSLSFQFFTCMHLRDKIKHTATKDDTLLGNENRQWIIDFSLQIGWSSPSPQKRKSSLSSIIADFFKIYL